ncbi:hypothetical protein D1871_21380 [Nakamurella silvestris]|nr:hypothetical protein D1871_21380 [Nakamurella silvestris]
MLSILLGITLGIGPGIGWSAGFSRGQNVRWLPFWVGLGLGAAYAVVLVLLMRYVMRIRDDHLALAAVMMLPFAGWSGTTAVDHFNQAVDRAPVQIHVVTVLGYTHAVKGPSHNTVQHWADGEAPFTIEGNFDPGSSVLIRVHPGNLGFEWIDSPPVPAPTRPH